MPAATAHIGKAERNEEFYAQIGLSSSKFNEWAIVCLFYITVHYVDAVLAGDSSLSINYQHPESHKDRHAAIAKCGKLSNIAIWYYVLYDRSLDARYKCIIFNNDYLAKFETRTYEPIRKNIRTTLGLPK